MGVEWFKLAGNRSGRSRVFSALAFCCAFLLFGGAREAKASFIGYYAFQNFTLTNTGGIFPNGFASSPDSNTVVLTGSIDGSDIGGVTEFTITAPSAGLFQFSYLFSTIDIPTYEFAGYVYRNGLFQFADTDGQAGSVSIPVLTGDVIGFYVGTFDNTGGPGVLTVTDFNAPAPVSAPEPGSLSFLLIGAAAASLGWYWRRKRLLLEAPAAGLALLIAGILGLTSAAKAQQTSYNGTNVTGQMVLTAVVNATQQANTPQSLGAIRMLGASVDTKSAGPRLHPPVSTSKLLGAAIAPPPIKGLSVITPGGLFGFNAISHLDQRNANNGNQFSVEPPNQSIAVGNNFVLEGVNNAVQIYNLSGAPLLPLVISSNQLFGVSAAINRQTGVNGVFPTDMRVFYDRDMNRFIVLQRAQDNDAFGNESNSSHLYMAVSQTGDPTGNYNVYTMNTTNAAHIGCPCIDDYPQIGADQYGFHIAWNEFNTSTQQFVDAAILSLGKSALAAGSSTPPAFQFFIPFSTGFEFALQPATTPPGASYFAGLGGGEYFVSTLASFGSGNQLALWAMTGTSTLALGSPNLSLVQIPVPIMRYVTPNVATQRPGSTPLGSSQGAGLEFLDAGDPRVQALSYASGRLFLTFQTGVNDENGAFLTGGAYVVLTPTYRGGTLAAQVINEGYLVVNGEHILRPAIAVNAQGVGAIAVTLTGQDWDPSAAFIPFSTTATPTTLEVAAVGALPEDGFTGYPSGGGDGLARWGDYNTAVASSDGAIWMVMQYIANLPRTTSANWNTYVVRYQQ